MREQKFTILKAIAIILVVLSHAGTCGWLNQIIYSFHVPIFFFCAGYFFNTAYLNDEKTYVLHRIKGLYFPFVRWSIFFLLIHNLLFYTGILNETYGNSAGGVTHPFTWHTFSQNLWSIIFNMSGYDTFLCGAFWFFRALFVSSIAFIILFKILSKIVDFRNDKSIGWIIFFLSFLLMIWKTTTGLNITGMAQGGARELTGVGFMAIGFLTNRYSVVSRLNWKLALPCLAILVTASILSPSAMYWKPTLSQYISLLVPAFCGFMFCLFLSQIIDHKSRYLKRLLVYIGDRTLYVFAFHLVSFKLVSAIKVAWYGLPWLAIGGHPYVIEPSNNAIWVFLYLIVGVGLPILCLECHRTLSAKYDLSNRQLLNYVLTGFCLLFKALYFIIHKMYLIVKNLFLQLWLLLKDMLKASSFKEED